MPDQTTTRRDRGEGSLILRPSPGGGERWIAKWRDGGRQIQRGIGPKRSKAHPHGLTKHQAEAVFGRLRDEVQANPRRPDRRTLAEVGEALVKAKRGEGRKRATIEAYDYWLRVHIVPHFGPKDVAKIDRKDVQIFAEELASEPKPLAPKSLANGLGILHSLFEFAIEEGWSTPENPVKRVRKPVSAAVDSDIHFLSQEDVEALLRAVPDDALGRVERVMYLTAAMTGLRQGELLALRWLDVDWPAQRIRVRRNFVRGEYGTPKSKRSSRSVPMAVRVAAELERLFQTSDRRGDEDLVFAHPVTGRPIDRSKLLKRYKAALKAANLGPFEIVRDRRGEDVPRPTLTFHDLRHTFGTRMAAEGVPMRTLQEWMGHRDFKTTLIYADYAPSEHEAEWVERAFATPTPEIAIGDVVQS